jgi:hypothetical protein
MTQKDKELLLKDICARLPYGVKMNHIADDEHSPKTLIGVAKDMITLEGLGGYECVDTEDYKPYLFPLSSITDEQERELSKLGVSYGEYALHDDIRGLGIMVDDAYIFFEFCYKHHIDFLGLIEMGLAIDATDKNIY